MQIRVIHQYSLFNNIPIIFHVYPYHAILSLLPYYYSEIYEFCLHSKFLSLLILGLLRIYSHWIGYANFP